MLMRCLLVVVLMGNVCAGWVYAANTDVPNAADPLNLPRFPHSWIVDYQQDDQLLAREFVISRVDKTRS